ncbi:polyketide synthase, partial [Streptomyces sp. HSW2009]
LELGPDPTLTTATQHTLHHHTTNNTEAAESADAAAPVLVAALSRKQPEAQAFAQALGKLHVHGVRVDWTGWFPTSPRPAAVELPTYAFQHQRFWLAPAEVSGAGAEGGHDAAEAELWDAVEREDLAALARTLDSPEDQQSMLGAVLPTLSAWRRANREQSVIDSWRYQVVWPPLTVEPAPTGLTGTWLLVVPDGFTDHPAVHIAAQALAEQGVSVVRQVVGAVECERDELADALAELVAGSPLSGVVSLLALAEEPHPDYHAVSVGLAGTTALIQALGDTDINAPLWCLTQGA